MAEGVTGRVVTPESAEAMNLSTFDPIQNRPIRRTRTTPAMIHGARVRGVTNWSIETDAGGCAPMGA